MQDALRDARDEASESKAENQRLVNILDAAGIDHHRPAGDGGSLLPPNQPTASMANSPSPGDFNLAFSAGGVQSGGPLTSEQQPPLDTYSPFYNPSGSLPSSDFLTQQKAAAHTAGGSGPHSRQVSLDAQARSPGHFDAFGIARPGSAASGTSSHSSAHSLHGAFDGSVDLEPSMTGGKAPPGLQMFDDLNLYGNAMAALPSGGPGPSPWNAGFIGPGDQQQQQVKQEQQETDLGRSDTVKASDSRHAHRRSHLPTSPLPSIPQTQAQSMEQQQQQQQQQPQQQPPPQQPHEMYNQMVEDPTSSFEFDPYGVAAQRNSRPGSSASSLFSNEGDVGHHYHHTHPQLHQHQQQHMPAEMEDGAYYSSEGDFNDLDYMEGMEGGPGGMTLVDSLMVPSHPGGFGPGMDPAAIGLSSSPMNSNLSGGSTFGGQPPDAFSASPGVNAMFPGNLTGNMSAGMGGTTLGGVGGTDPQQIPMSSTLAMIKAQAFGTSRKARTRAKRAGADSAAKVAMEALQARAHGLGLDVDLAGENDPQNIGGASVSRSSATVKRRPKPDDAPKG